MDSLLCDKCRVLIKPNEEYHSVTIRGESYSLNDSNVKEFDVDMSEYRHYDICSSCYVKLEQILKGEPYDLQCRASKSSGRDKT